MPYLVLSHKMPDLKNIYSRSVLGYCDTSASAVAEPLTTARTGAFSLGNGFGLCLMAQRNPMYIHLEPSVDDGHSNRNRNPCKTSNFLIPSVAG